MQSTAIAKQGVVLVSVKDFRHFTQTLHLSLIRLQHPTSFHLLMVICSAGCNQETAHTRDTAHRGARPFDFREAASPQVTSNSFPLGFHEFFYLFIAVYKVPVARLLLA